MTDSATNPIETVRSQDSGPKDALLQPPAEPEQAVSKNVEALAQELAEMQANAIKLQHQLEDAQAKIDAQDAQIVKLNASSVTASKLADQQSEQLERTNQNNDQLSQQLRRLESQLQASHQHTTEQEDALLHWQELAETTQIQLKKLEKQQETRQRQLEESGLSTNKLREKNSRLEYEWQRTLMELNDLRDRIPEDSVAELQDALAESQQTLRSLNAIIADSDEQLLWYKANLKTAQHALEQSPPSSPFQEKTPDNKLQKTKITVLKEMNHHKSAQIDAYKSEIEHHLTQMAAQGQRLAEIQASLIERELQLKQAIAKSEKQSEFIKRMKQVTDKRIQHLETQLAQAEQQLRKD